MVKWKTKILTISILNLFTIPLSFSINKNTSQELIQKPPAPTIKIPPPKNLDEAIDRIPDFIKFIQIVPPVIDKEQLMYSFFGNYTDFIKANFFSEKVFSQEQIELKYENKVKDNLKNIVLVNNKSISAEFEDYLLVQNITKNNLNVVSNNNENSNNKKENINSQKDVNNKFNFWLILITLGPFIFFIFLIFKILKKKKKNF